MKRFIVLALTAALLLLGFTAPANAQTVTNKYGVMRTAHHGVAGIINVLDKTDYRWQISPSINAWSDNLYGGNRLALWYEPLTDNAFNRYCGPDNPCIAVYQTTEKGKPRARVTYWSHAFRAILVNDYGHTSQGVYDRMWKKQAVSMGIGLALGAALHPKSPPSSSCMMWYGPTGHELPNWEDMMWVHQNYPPY